MKNERAKYVVIGASVAGMAAAAGIRAVDPAGRLVIVSEETEFVYSRPLISYWLAGAVDDERMRYRDDAFIEKNKIELKLGARVERVDAAAHEVTFADGTALGYEKLLLATGGSPIRPPIEGVTPGLKGVFSLVNWDDAKQIDRYCVEHRVKHAVVLGAGMIGLKATEALIARGIHVVLVELAERVLPAMFDPDAAKLARVALEEAKVKVFTGTTVGEVLSSRDKVRGVQIKDGPELLTDMFVIAIGVRPRVDLAKAAGVTINRGIVVDERMQSSDPDIYAAGDVAEAQLLLDETSMPVPILPNAFRQGRIAGENMAGGAQEFEGSLPMNAIDVCGLPTISVGASLALGEPYEVIKKIDWKKRTYRKIVLRDGRVVGAMFIGDIDRAGIFTGLIRQRADISAIKQDLLDDDFGLIQLPSEYRKHVIKGGEVTI